MNTPHFAPTQSFSSEEALSRFLEQTLPRLRVDVPYENALAVVHFHLQASGTDWFLTYATRYRAGWSLIGLIATNSPQFSSRIYEMGSIDFQELLIRPDYQPLVDKQWQPKTMATLVRELRSQGYRSRDEVHRYC